MLIKSKVAYLIAIVVVVCLAQSSHAFNFKSRAFLNTRIPTAVKAVQKDQTIWMSTKENSMKRSEYISGGLRNQETSLNAATTAAPIVKEEPENFGKTMKKILPLGAMLFFILFNYTILRDTKDVLVVTAPGGGAATTSRAVHTK